MFRFWSLGYLGVRESGWQGHWSKKNLPRVGVEVCKNLVEIGKAVCKQKRDIEIGGFSKPGRQRSIGKPCHVTSLQRAAKLSLHWLTLQQSLVCRKVTSPSLAAFIDWSRPRQAHHFMSQCTVTSHYIMLRLAAVTAVLGKARPAGAPKDNSILWKCKSV